MITEGVKSIQLDQKEGNQHKKKHSSATKCPSNIALIFWINNLKNIWKSLFWGAPADTWVKFGTSLAKRTFHYGSWLIYKERGSFVSCREWNIYISTSCGHWSSHLYTRHVAPSQTHKLAVCHQIQHSLRQRSGKALAKSAKGTLGVLWVCEQLNCEFYVIGYIMSSTKLLNLPNPDFPLKWLSVDLKLKCTDVYMQVLSKISLKCGNTTMHCYEKVIYSVSIIGQSAQCV